jgi:hypothetical protein
MQSRNAANRGLPIASISKGGNSCLEFARTFLGTVPGERDLPAQLR